MIYTSGFRLGENNREIFPDVSQETAYICNYAVLDNYLDKSFPWHWHTAFEIDYIAEGEVELRTSQEVFQVKKGEAFFINSNIMHHIRAKDRQKGCRLYAHIFDMHFLSGMYNSLFEQKYMSPVVKSRELQAYVIRPDSGRRIQMIERLLHTLQLNRQEAFGYEFEVRAALGQFWLLLLEETKEMRALTTEKRNTDIKRLKAMMQYIHHHYMDRMALEDISRAASISSRECTRCFQRCIEMSPVSYLNSYRVRMAARMLLETEDSILTISENCGFSSGSYFGKVFHQATGCTPKEYRSGKKAEE